MKTIPFKDGAFITSALKKRDFPFYQHSFPEIALVGRSNVGKSSLLNHLLSFKGLAKVSGKPGKTRLINFFLIDDRLSLVDLPGYGYAPVSHQLKDEWREGIHTYLHCRNELKLILFLLDIRHLPSEEDIAFFEWCIFHNKSILIVFTKTDKISKPLTKKNSALVLKNLNAICGNKSLSSISYSIKDPLCRRLLIEKINHTLGIEWD